MKKLLTILAITALSTSVLARPSSYTELIDYVQAAPDQGETATCMFVANTGAMELLANKKEGIKNPKSGGKYDLAESFIINAPWVENGATNYDGPVHSFNRGFGYHISDWPYDAWRGTYENKQVWWDHPDRAKLPKVELPAVESVYLFQYGRKHSQGVLEDKDIEAIKEALWKYKSPVLVNYVDDSFWHVILIVGYDDEVPGECYEVEDTDCSKTVGSFYIRDSFGVRVQLRDTDWFKYKGNAAAVIKLKD